jgi:peptidyl-prolyl cis-trans isomerase D
VATHDISKPRELADAKSEVVSKIKSQQAALQLKAKAESMKEQLVAGSAIAALAAQEKITPIVARAKKRANKEVDAELLSAAFKMAKPSEGSAVADTVQLANGDWAVLHLLAVEDVALSADSAEFKAVQQRLESGAGTADFTLYEQGLRKAADIVRKKAASENGGEG